MTQPTHLAGSTYAVELPEGAENIRISQLIGMPKLFADIPGYLYAAKLPPGNWQLICPLKEVIRSQAAELVQWFEIDGTRGFRDYAFPDDLKYPFLDPISSWRSLLKAKELDPNKNYVLIKKVS